MPRQKLRQQTLEEDMHIILEIVAAVLFADFISGVMHWVEDSYGNPEWPVIGPLVIRPNIVRHEEPSAFTKHSWLRSASVLLIPGAIVLAAAWACGMLTWHVMLVVALGLNANQFHKWNHMPAKQKENSWFCFRSCSFFRRRNSMAGIMPNTRTRTIA
ncbi:MAG: fatty acid desaturase CarF family protein [Pseudomonadota bacterium]|nr:fatty acid desaturase CarF family protein [Pseudomonadota bacterium]